ncbi:hypothetical protein [Candidatus Sororendozoicomonas aggregata]|uniref:CAF17-like 4Fe-4S cluster assembly/insertion protein YgfZ n=1 Tax=Candidatus Sororendozoicomonas aggregata TaxID=3073239 RepID=UPI002ED1199A
MSTHWKDYLITQGATFSEQGEVSGFQLNDPVLPTTSPTLCVLTQQAILMASGPDTQRFFQGQLSCNMNTCDASTHSPGVLCTPKGRMVASFRLLNTGNNYLIALHHSVVDAFTQTLSKYAVFFKSTLGQPETPYLCLGLMGDTLISAVLSSLTETPPEGRQAVQLHRASWLLKSDNLRDAYELWLPENALSYWWERLCPLMRPVTENIWSRRRIEAGVPQVQSDFSEKYIPQHLNFPSLGYVSFKKGCYTGQEIVTRMQNLGQQKSRAYPLTCHTPIAIAPGTKLHNAQGKSVGEILESLPSDRDQQAAIAVIRIDAAEDNDLVLDDERKSKVSIARIPYPIEPKAELQF